MFNIKDTVVPYTLKTCARVIDIEGRRATGFIVESADGWMSLPLPMLTECNMIPNNRSEIPTPAAAQSHSHLKIIADKIPPLDPNAKILLLLGRDILRVHKVQWTPQRSICPEVGFGLGNSWRCVPRQCPHTNRCEQHENTHAGRWQAKPVYPKIGRASCRERGC